MGCIYRRKVRQSDGTLIETGPYWIKYYRNGRGMHESSKSEKESDARRLLQQREGDIARGVPVTPKIGRVTVDDLIEDLKNEYRINGRKSFKDMERRCAKHLIPFFGGRRATAITTRDARSFIAARQEAGASNAEINRELAALRRAFTLAVQGSRLLFQPHIPVLEENNVRTGFFEREEFEAVRGHLPEEIKPVVTFAYITGWRTNSEILTLLWKQVDFQAGMVRLEVGSTKNKKGRQFPFSIDKELAEVLEGQRVKTQSLQKEKGVICPWVFHRDGNRIKDFRGAWEEACRLSGVPDRIPHDFRRTAVRNLTRAGVTRSVAMELTGHKTDSVFRRYDIVSEPDLIEAVERLQLLKKVTKEA